MCHFLSQARLHATALILMTNLLSLTGTAQTVSAQESRTGPAARPGPLGTDVSISPELEKILQTWEQESGKVNRMRGEFTRVEYDKVFATAKNVNGRYWYEQPDKGRMDFIPDAALASAPPKEVEKGGIKYSVKADDAKCWICDGEQILDVDLAKKEYNRAGIPPQYQGKNISDGPLPFLFGMKADKIKQRYVLELGSMHDPKKMIHIVAYPKHPAEQREYRVAEVLLDPTEYMPRAIQLVDTTGNKQTVYMFTKHEKITLPFLPPPGPFKPLLLSYKKIHDSEAPPPLEREVKQGEGGIFR